MARKRRREAGDARGGDRQAQRREELELARTKDLDKLDEAVTRLEARVADKKADAEQVERDRKQLQVLLGRRAALRERKGRREREDGELERLAARKPPPGPPEDGKFVVVGGRKVLLGGSGAVPLPSRENMAAPDPPPWPPLPRRKIPSPPPLPEDGAPPPPLRAVPPPPDAIRRGADAGKAEEPDKQQLAAGPDAPEPAAEPRQPVRAKIDMDKFMAQLGGGGGGGGGGSSS